MDDLVALALVFLLYQKGRDSFRSTADPDWDWFNRVAFYRAGSGNWQKHARRPPEIELVLPRMLALILARGKYVRLRAASLTRNA